MWYVGVWVWVGVGGGQHAWWVGDCTFSLSVTRQGGGRTAALRCSSVWAPLDNRRTGPLVASGRQVWLLLAQRAGGTCLRVCGEVLGTVGGGLQEQAGVQHGRVGPGGAVPPAQLAEGQLALVHHGGHLWRGGEKEGPGQGAGWESKGRQARGGLGYGRHPAQLRQHADSIPAGLSPNWVNQQGSMLSGTGHCPLHANSGQKRNGSSGGRRRLLPLPPLHATCVNCVLLTQNFGAPISLNHCQAASA